MTTNVKENVLRKEDLGLYLRLVAQVYGSKPLQELPKLIEDEFGLSTSLEDIEWYYNMVVQEDIERANREIEYGLKRLF